MDELELAQVAEGPLQVCRLHLPRLRALERVMAPAQAGQQAALARAGEAGIEQCGEGFDVLGGERDLIDAAHGVADLETGVPERVEEPGRVCLVAAVRDEQHQVHIGVAGLFAAAVATDGDHAEVHDAEGASRSSCAFGRQFSERGVGELRSVREMARAPDGILPSTLAPLMPRAGSTLDGSYSASVQRSR